MQFRYPARLQPDRSGEIIVSFRVSTSRTAEAEALIEARDELEEAIAGLIDDGEPIPVPSRRRVGEQLIAVPPDIMSGAGPTGNLFDRQLACSPEEGAGGQKLHCPAQASVRTALDYAASFNATTNSQRDLRWQHPSSIYHG